MRRMLFGACLFLLGVVCLFQVSRADDSLLLGVGGKSTSASGQTQVAVTFVASTSEAFVTDHASICIQNSTYNCQATPVELTFNSGSHGFSISAGQTITSDWVSFAFTSATGTVFSSALGSNDNGNQNYAFRTYIPQASITGATGPLIIDFDNHATGTIGMQKTNTTGFVVYYITPTSTYYNQQNPSGTWSSVSNVGPEAVSTIQAR